MYGHLKNVLLSSFCKTWGRLSFGLLQFQNDKSIYTTVQLNEIVNVKFLPINIYTGHRRVVIAEKMRAT